MLAVCFTAGITFLLRKVFLNTLTVELLGYEGLFGNLFSILSLANLGINSLILYRLFPAFAKRDNKQISQLMSIYRVLYRYIGLFIFAIGMAMIPMLHLIVNNKSVQWNYVYLIYIIQLMGTLCTYFLAYKRIVFNVNQQEYICTRIDAVISVTENIIRIVLLLLFKSYLLYLICDLLGTLIGNYIISRRVDSSFRDVSFDQKVTLKDIRALHIFHEIKNSFIQQVCFVIYGGTDNIIISYLFGVGTTGLLANYTLIESYVTRGLTKLFHSFQMSIGNYVYSENGKDGECLFRMFDFLSYWIACIVCVTYALTYNPIISYLFGKQYLLSSEFVFSFTINQYITWNHLFLTYYRQSFGKYELDTIPIVLAAILNIVISIILGKYIGIAGVMIGTAIGHLGIWFGRVRVVYHEYIHERISKYVIRQAIRLVGFGIQFFLAYIISKNINNNFIGIITRLFIGVSLPITFVFVCFYRTKEMKYCMVYLKRVKREVLKGKDK